MVRCPHCGFAPGGKATEATHLKPGSKLQDRYLVGLAISYTGFGVTYHGYNEALDTRLMIKEYLPGEFSTRMPGQSSVSVFSGVKSEQFEAGKESFLEEARRLIEFRSEPEIIHVLDAFEENNTAYLVTEYLEGETLEEKLKREGPMTVEEALPIIYTVLDGLEKVHAKNLLHRDIAPNNIWIGKDGKVKIINFGAARFASTSHSRSLTVLIQQGYAPEEQYRSRGDQGPHTDVYAVAATFYNMITGKVPQEALARLADDRLEKPSALGVKISRSMENALMNALNVRIVSRTKSAAEFRQALESGKTRRTKEKKRTQVPQVPAFVKISTAIGLALIAVFAAFLLRKALGPGDQTSGSFGLGSNETRVPNIINKDIPEAETITAEQHLQMVINGKSYDSTIPEDYILSQELQSGTIVAYDTPLNVKVSAGIRQTMVPRVVGFSKEDAEQMVLDADLIPEFEEQDYAAAPGSIASQSLEPETFTDTGTTIKLVVSKGLPGGDSSVMEIVGDLIGRDFEEAAAENAEHFLYLMVSGHEYSSDYPEGAIISQDPAPGTEVPQNSNITTVVSLGPEMTYVPEVVYLTQDEAETMIEEARLRVNVREEYSSNVEKGRVTRVEPGARTQVELDTEITIWISLGPQPRVEPVTTAPVVRPTNPPAPATEPYIPPTEPPATAPPETPAPTPAPAPEPQPQPQTVDDSIWRLVPY